jgi:hypothetical protein
MIKKLRRKPENRSFMQPSYAFVCPLTHKLLHLSVHALPGAVNHAVYAVYYLLAGSDLVIDSVVTLLPDLRFEVHVHQLSPY